MKRFFPLVILAAIGLLLAACTTAATPTAPETPEEAMPTGPMEGGTMTWARFEPCEGACGNANLSPGNYVFFHSQNPAFLTACSEAGNVCNLPGIAERWEESADHLTWTFYLRDDVTWSDGTPSTADDWVFTYNMITNPEFGDVQQVTWKDIAGWQAFQDGTADHLAGIEKVDDYTIRFTMSVVKRREPQDFSIEVFLQPYHLLKDKTIAEWIDLDIADRISVGPYYFSDIVYDQYYAMKANPYFYLGEPYIKDWVYRAIPNWAVSIAGLKSGEIDVVDVTPLDEVPGLEEEEHLNILPDAMARGYLFWLNQETLPKKIRQALQMSIDRQLIIDTLWEGYGWTYPCRARPQGVPLEGVIPDANVFDPDGARALIAEAVADGDWDSATEVRLYYYYSTEFTKQIMAAVADMWTEVGINVLFQLLPTDQIVQVFYVEGDYDVLYGCCADPGNSEHYIALQPYYTCGAHYPDGYNATGVCFEELDQALVTINQTFDRAEEIAAYQTACTYLVGEVVDMPLWMSPGLWTVNGRIHNTETEDGYFNEYVHTWWIEQ